MKEDRKYKYIAPETDIIEIYPTQILCGSHGNDDESGTDMNPEEGNM